MKVPGGNLRVRVGLNMLSFSKPFPFPPVNTSGGVRVPPGGSLKRVLLTVKADLSWLSGSRLREGLRVLVTNGNWSVLIGITTGGLSKVPSMTSIPSASLGIWSRMEGVGLMGLLWGLRLSCPEGGTALGIPITLFPRGGC